MKILNAALLTGILAMGFLVGCTSDDDDTTIIQITGNRAPVAVNLSLQATKGFASLQVNFAGSDPDGDAVTFMVSSQPAVGMVALQSTGTYLFTAPSVFAGIVTFTYVAHDGTLASAPATVTVDVANDTTPDPYLVSAALWQDNNSNQYIPLYHIGISADGRYVAFNSREANFLASDANGTMETTRTATVK